jgi:hypothetical protein
LNTLKSIISFKKFENPSLNFSSSIQILKDPRVDPSAMENLAIGLVSGLGYLEMVKIHDLNQK